MSLLNHARENGFSDSTFCPKQGLRRHFNYEAMDEMSELAATAPVSAPGGKHLAPYEVLRALDSLSEGDKIRLWRIERRDLFNTNFAEGDLLHEAICDAVLEIRKCPRDESFVAFPAESMRSIASHQRKRLQRHVPITGGGQTTAPDGDGGVDLEDGRLNPEESTIAKDEEQYAAEVLANLRPASRDARCAAVSVKDPPRNASAAATSRCEKIDSLSVLDGTIEITWPRGSRFQAASAS